ncbi:MAG: SDR family NAD(P)-dependent oxidoreductase [Gluconacetobacter diazotrophicus]|nr:SDR family NAD(P)-dependent oxidoreductase [Gluconacetobacter diazotrophicus]
MPDTVMPDAEPTPPHAGVVLITGASSGIGLCSAALFAARGWRVGLVARSRPGLDAAARLIGERTPGAATCVAIADVADGAALADAARAVAAALGSIDAWVNAAGNGVYGRFTEVPEAEFRRVTEVTYGGTVNGTRVALQHMAPRNRGAIVNVCSAVVVSGVPLMTSYCGAKAAVRCFGQSLTQELRIAGSRVRVATLIPPAINTPFFDNAPSHMGFPARPVPPVYRTEVAARGVYAAATGAGGELLLTGVISTYSILARVSPRLAAFLVSLSDFASELPRSGEDGRDHVPTLFGTRERGHSMHGPFGARARDRSWQEAARSAARGAMGTLRRRFSTAATPPDRARARAGARFPATPGTEAPGRTAADSARPDAAA